MMRGGIESGGPLSADHCKIVRTTLTLFRLGFFKVLEAPPPPPPPPLYISESIDAIVMELEG